jgi:signal transduction histidine kinase
MNRHTLALQRLALEMRELTDPNVSALPDHTQQPIPLDTLIWSVANEWRQIAHANNLKLHVIIEKGGLQVVGSERRLRWALGNLVDNAIKYTPPGGDLTLEIRADNGSDQAHLRIRDNGVGIAQAELPYIFQRFYRGRPVTPEGRVIRVPGTGQGLTTARQIITAHGGTLIIKSRQGLGTAAYITLPLTAGVQMSLPRMTDELDGETMQLDMRSIQGRKRL